MAIKKIKVTNFKSFKNLEIELGDLNILIGANASGKSNFVEIFRFLRDIRNSGLENAISLQGGIEYLKNMNDSSSELSLEFISNQEVSFRSTRGWGIDVYETTYEFTVAFSEDELGFEIVEDKLVQQCKFTKLVRQEKETKEVELGPGEITVFSVDGKLSFDLINAPEEVQKEESEIFPWSFIPEKLPHGILLLEASLPFIMLRPMLDNDIPIYDFDAKLPKRFTSIAGKADLEEDGSNLAAVLKNIIGKENERRKLLNLVGDLLDFVDDLDVETSVNKSLLLRIREIYSSQYLPASLISDGTINMIALVVALYFEKKPLTIIEEPERNIHPYLISRVVNMMEDASLNKQIIVTTHNPEMIRYADKKDILLVSRNEEGFSSICRPSEKEDVKTFLEHGLRMEELYVDSFLEI